MKLDRVFAFLAFAMAAAALGISLVALKRPDPLGTDIAKYDLSSPQRTLESVNAMVANQDLRAGWQLARVLMDADNSPDTKLFFSSGVKITGVKSVEVADSAGPKNNGLIVSYIRFSVSGVDYHTVKYFRRDGLNRFHLAETFYIPYGTEGNLQDKALQAAIDKFKEDGKL